VRLYSRPGNDLTYRFPLIVEALTRLRSRSCIIDGEAVACGDDGIASFDRIRHQHHDGSVFLYAFDLIELNGDDLRRDPLNVRKATLASVLARAATGLRLNEYLEADGPTVFVHEPASSASKGSCQRGRIRAIVPAARRTGSSRRISRRRQ
jgi:bifunctional non-homologous end joining protein LigD